MIVVTKKMSNNAVTSQKSIVFIVLSDDKLTTRALEWLRDWIGGKMEPRGRIHRHQYSIAFSGPLEVFLSVTHENFINSVLLLLKYLVAFLHFLSVFY